MASIEWEAIETPHTHRTSTERARIPGGWLVKFSEHYNESGAGGLTFVPDPDHTWK